MKPQRNDGKALERAVQMIQDTLIRSMPGMKADRFSIEVRKRINLGGECLEFDVYVVMHPGSDYESVVVFECKDWKKPVGAGEVMKFGVKVERIGAAKGIIVAKALTSDAEVELRKQNRLTFKRRTDEIASLLTLNLIHTVHESMGGKPQLTAFSPSVAFPPNLTTKQIRVAHRVMTMEQFGIEQFKVIANADKIDSRNLHEQESIHWLEDVRQLNFAPGECEVAGVPIADIFVHAAAFVYVVPHTPCYHCTVDGDGHVVSFELVDRDFPDGKLDVNLVITTKKRTASQA